MTLALLALNLGLMLVLVVIGVAIERDGRVEARRRSLPGWLQTIVGGLALGGPWLLYFRGILPEAVAGGTIDGIVVTLAISLVLWMGYPPLVARFVETETSSPSPTGC